eukprot:scaffold10.g2279.t1
MAATLRTINEATKWVVSAAVAATLVWSHDAAAAWCVVGAVAAAALCRALKFVINHQRPEGARKADPGMPSAHANSLAFLATYVSLASAAAACGGAVAAAPLARALAAAPASLLLMVGVPTCAIALAWLRVVLGYHTVPQVAVGWLVGSSSAALWHAWGRSAVLPRLAGDPLLQASRAALAGLWALTATAVAAFAWQHVRRWFKEHREEQAGAAAAAAGAVADAALQ